MVKMLRTLGRAGLLLAVAGCLLAAVAGAQNPITAGDPPSPGSSMPGNKELPAKAGEQLEPDLFTKYKTDPETLRSLRLQAELRSEERQKQIVEATNLLLQIAQDLRSDLASQPVADADGTAKTRLEHIQKLARMIREREKNQDGISTDLAKAGVL